VRTGRVVERRLQLLGEEAGLLRPRDDDVTEGTVRRDHVDQTQVRQDGNGEPEKDLVGNRGKRFFTDNRVLVRGARHGLGEAAEALPDRAGRGAFQGAADLAESASLPGDFLVQTYARDTGAILTVLNVPLYVCGERYGSTLLGWPTEA